MIGAQLGKQVRLRHRDHPGLDSEQPEHVEMLGRLRHRPLVGGDTEHRHVDSTRCRDHRAQEALVTGDVHDAGGPDPRQLEVCIPGLERDAAALFLRQAIRVDARERADQRSLAVVDVPGGSDDDAERAAHSSTHDMPGASFFLSSSGSPRITATGAAQ